MTDDQKKGPGMDKRQMITAGVTAVILLIVVYQIYALFADSSGGGTSLPPPQTAEEIAQHAQIQASMVQPKKGDLTKNPEMTQHEQELMQAQQMLQAKYAASLNELQMLKIQSDIAKTNNDIMKNRLDTIKSQKDIVDLLTTKPPTEDDYARGLATPTAQGASVDPSQQGGLDAQVVKPSSSLTVISVTKLHGVWNAVLGVSGKLYQVAIDDVLPSNDMKVVEIDQSGVVLQDKNGQSHKYSLVSII